MRRGRQDWSSWQSAVSSPQRETGNMRPGISTCASTEPSSFSHSELLAGVSVVMPRYATQHHAFIAFLSCFFSFFVCVSVLTCCCPGRLSALNANHNHFLVKTYFTALCRNGHSGVEKSTTETVSTSLRSKVYLIGVVAHLCHEKSVIFKGRPTH